MKLSQILLSQCIYQGGNGSWGIYVSPENSSYVVKLFYDEQGFNSKKDGYDKTLGEPSLEDLANQYIEIDIQLDVVDSRGTPFNKALLHLYLKNPPWKSLGKLSSTCEFNKSLADKGLNVESALRGFLRVGVVWTEVTVFMRSNPRDFRVIDLTYCKAFEEIQEEENH